jgi:co-chaperonin GroES (HSP10)
MMDVVNKSGLKPLGRAVLIEPYAPALGSTLIHIPDDVMGREQMVEQRARIIAIGDNCWCDEPTPRAQVGDRVLVARYAGFQAQGTADGKMYRFVNDRDIFAAIDLEV